MSPARRLPPTLVALTPGTLRGERSVDALCINVERAVLAAIGAGLRGLILREPFLEDGATLELGLRLAEALRRAGGWFGIHDRVHLAPAMGADGVHLGGRSLNAPDAREVLRDSDVAIGVSSHVDDDLNLYADADYLFHAPVFPPTSKDDGNAEPVGIPGIEGVARDAGLPVWALGGVTPERIHAFGPNPSVAGVALIGSLWGTGPEPISGSGRSPLMDLSSIEQRADELAAAARSIFGQPDRP